MRSCQVNVSKHKKLHSLKVRRCSQDGKLNKNPGFRGESKLIHYFLRSSSRLRSDSSSSSIPTTHNTRASTSDTHKRKRSPSPNKEGNTVLFIKKTIKPKL